MTTDHIEKTSIYEFLNPTLYHLKKLKQLKLTVEDCHCPICNKPRRLSNKPYELFVSKTTCGSQECIKAIRKKKFKNTIKRRKSSKPTHQYTESEIREWIIDKINSGVRPDRISTFKEDVARAVKINADKNSMKMTEYCYRLFHNIPVDKLCGYFQSFKNGFYSASDINLAAQNRKLNKINSLINEWNELKDYSVLKTAPINEEPWKIRCEKCHKVNEVWCRNGFRPKFYKCDYCFPKTKSRIEFDLIDEISEFYNGPIIHSFKLKKDQSANASKEIDLFFPEFNFGVEVNGVYWHSDGNKWRHKEKFNLAADQGITLIQFTEHDLSRKREICMSMIKSRLNLVDKIGARETFFGEVTIDDYRKFMEDNHISGYASAKHKFGLFTKKNNELVLCVSFSRSRFKEDELELVRFATKRNLKVSGGFSKILTHVPFDRFVTYANLHYGTGNVYSKELGFKQIGETDPNYFYYFKGSLLSRQSCMKSKLNKVLGENFNPKLTERENMENAGAKIYFDAGSKKFIWTKQNLLKSYK